MERTKTYQSRAAFHPEPRIAQEAHEHDPRQIVFPSVVRPRPAAEQRVQVPQQQPVGARALHPCHQRERALVARERAACHVRLEQRGHPGR